MDQPEKVEKMNYAHLPSQGCVVSISEEGPGDNELIVERESEDLGSELQIAVNGERVTVNVGDLKTAIDIVDQFEADSVDVEVSSG